MKVYDEKKEMVAERVSKRFGDLKNGTVFTNGGRALVKVSAIWRPHFHLGDYDNDRLHPPIEWERVNAIRLAHVHQQPHSCDGQFSSFDDSTMVTVCPDATIYLKG
jgi:hypothetical protein